MDTAGCHASMESRSKDDLKSRFIELHRGSFPEMRLASLAEIFISTRFEGCRYSPTIMTLMDSLTEDLEPYINNFRSRHHQRTLAPYSCLRPKSSSGKKSEGMKYDMFVRAKEETVVTEPPVPLQKEPSDSFLQNLSLYNDGPFSKFIVYKKRKTNFVQDLTLSAGHNEVPIKWDIPNTSPCVCSVYLNDTLVSSLEFESNLSASKKSSALAQVALEELMKQCYTILEMNEDCTEYHVIEPSQNSIGRKVTFENYGIGLKLLQNMGWKDNLNAKEEEKDPSSVFSFYPEYNQSQRKGLGMTDKENDTLSHSVIKKIEEYARGNSDAPLKFSPKFNNEQRKKIHKLALRYKLKSKSQGTGEERFLTLSRKPDVSTLFNDLKKNGGRFMNFKLIPPGST